MTPRQGTQESGCWEGMNELDVRVWVIDYEVSRSTLERLGDGRVVADKLGCGVGVLLVGEELAGSETLIPQGADQVRLVEIRGSRQQTQVDVAVEELVELEPRLVLAPGDCHGREWAARLAVRCGWQLISPALTVESRHGLLQVSALDDAHQYARQVEVERSQTAVVTLRAGVAESLSVNPDRSGQVIKIHRSASPESIVQSALVPADPATVDIRFARCLVAGGRGLGSKEAFDTLRVFAERISGGIAASRMAVDLGWIESDRQVGQTGKSVKPNLYIACGISGASHHLEGMSEAKHIVAINTDEQAPIFKVAHMGLVANLHEVLGHAIAEISDS